MSNRRYIATASSGKNLGSRGNLYSRVIEASLLARDFSLINLHRLHLGIQRFSGADCSTRVYYTRVATRDAGHPRRSIDRFPLDRSNPRTTEEDFCANDSVTTDYAPFGIRRLPYAL